MSKGSSTGKRITGGGGMQLTNVSIKPLARRMSVVADQQFQKGAILGNPRDVIDQIRHSSRPNVRMTSDNELEALKYIRKGQELRIDMSVQNRSTQPTVVDTYNLEKFTSGQNTQLYVTGYSGSGKTTLSKQLQRRYNAKVLDMDTLFDQEVKKQFPKAKLVGDSWKDVTEDEMDNAADAARKNAAKMFRQRRDKFVLEGIDIPGLGFDVSPKTSEMSVVIPRTGYLRSTYRASKRDEMLNPKDYIRKMTGINYRMYHQLQQVKKEFRRAGIKPQTLTLQNRSTQLNDLRDFGFEIDRSPRLTSGSLLKPEATQALQYARQQLPSQYNFVIKDAFRSLADQTYLVKEEEKNLKRSNPDNWKELLKIYTGGYEELKLKPHEMSFMNHRSGYTVDLSIDRGGSELDLGGVKYDRRDQLDYYEKKKNLTEEEKHIRDNRRLLKKTMRKAGFQENPTEWWHWGYNPSSNNAIAQQQHQQRK